MSYLAPNSLNLAMPRGRVSFAKFSEYASDTQAGEVDLGNVLALDLTQKFTYKDHLSARGPNNVLDASLISQMEMDIKFTPEERSKENMALFFLGSPDDQKTGGAGATTQTGATVTGQSLTPYLDRWLDLGKKYIKPGSITLTYLTVTWTEPQTQSAHMMKATDYAVDYENGLIMIRSANQLSFTEALAGVTVGYKYGTAKIPTFTQGTSPVIGFMRYVGTSEVGPKHQVKLWKVLIYPDSALKMLDQANIAGMSFSGKVFIDDDTGSHSTQPFHEVTELLGATSYPS